MHARPNRILNAAQVRARDRQAIQVHGLDGYTLMCRAGDAVVEEVQARWPDVRRLVVVCGGGNNAGDGLVIGRLAHVSGYLVHLICLAPTASLSGDAAIAHTAFVAAGGEVLSLEALSPALARAHLVIDAIFGTGLSRPVSGEYAQAVQAVNAAPAPVLAVDIPSGISADSGQVLGDAVRAQVTVSFVGLKIGCYLAAGPAHCGHIVFDDLGTGELLGPEQSFVARRLHKGVLRTTLPPRARDAHKGMHGHVLLIGGGEGMSGAIRLAAEAALRAGAGLVTVATSPGNVAIVAASGPEWMTVGVQNDAALAPLLARASVVAIGPGLGRGAWAQRVFATAIASGLPLVIDADGLNLLAQQSPAVRRGSVQDAPWIITPHPGEAATLLGLSSAQDVQQARLERVQALAARYRAVAVLKGAGTLVASEGQPVWLCDRGNPGMGAAGMGDVLTGVIAAIAGQCGNAHDAARSGVLVHALSGDEAALNGERGLMARDLMGPIRRWVNPD